MTARMLPSRALSDGSRGSLAELFPWPVLLRARLRKPNCCKTKREFTVTEVPAFSAPKVAHLNCTPRNRKPYECRADQIHQQMILCN